MISAQFVLFLSERKSVHFRDGGTVTRHSGIWLGVEILRENSKSFYLEFFVNQNTGAGKNRGKYGLCENAKGLIVRESYNVLQTHGQNSSPKFKIILLKMIFDKNKSSGFRFGLQYTVY